MHAVALRQSVVVRAKRQSTMTATFENPTVNPPRLGSFSRHSLHSSSPSRSPIRHAQDYDPLLRDLSPTKTLRAFAQSDDEAQIDALSKSMRSVSHSRRMLGVKAAQACADIRSWTREVEGWDWPGTFDAPEASRRKLRMSISSVFSLRPLSPDVPEGDDDYYGSLPKETVQNYERRVREIDESLEEIDVEELKDFVLSAHSRAAVEEASINDSIGTIGAATDLKQLDDFTALVTATILQALPFLSRLVRLLHTWVTRLEVLRAAPAYIRDLSQARTDLNHGWAALAVACGSNASAFSAETMAEMKKVILRQVNGLGRRLDRFLDQLEGRPEVVPEPWIEDFESLEMQYGQWVVQAERKVIEEQWRRAKAVQVEKAPSAVLDAGSDVANPTGDRHEVVLPRTALSSHPLNAPEGSSPSATTRFSERGSQHFSSPPRSNTWNTPATWSHRPQHISIQPFINHPREVSPAARMHPPRTPDWQATSKDRSPAHGSPNSPPDVDNTFTLNIKKRAALLSNGKKIDRLHKSKPPPIVRPFEHASNAFTRLFRRNSRDVCEFAPADRRDSTNHPSPRESSASHEQREIPRKSIINRENQRPDPHNATHGDLAAAPDTILPFDEPRGRKPSTRESMSHRHTKVYGDLSALPPGLSPGPERRSTPQLASVVSESRRTSSVSVPSSEGDAGTAAPGSLSSSWPLQSSAMPAEHHADRGRPSPGLMCQESMSPAESERGSSHAGGKAESRSLPASPLRSDASDEIFINGFSTRPRHSTSASSRARLASGYPASARDASRRFQEVTHGLHSDEAAAYGFQQFDYDEEDERSLSPGARSSQERDHSDIGDGAELGIAFDPKTSRERSNSVVSDSSGSDWSLPIQRHAAPSKRESKGRWRPQGVRQASIRSMESFARGQVKSIDITLRKAPNTPSTPTRQTDQRSPTQAAGGSPLEYKKGIVFPSPPSRTGPPSNPTSSPAMSRVYHCASDPDVVDVAHPPRVEVMGSPASATSSSEVTQMHSSTPQSSFVAGSVDTPGKEPEDNFDRHVSEVLDRVRAPIRFKTRPDVVKPRGTRDGKSYGRLQVQPERPATRNMTLAPVAVSSSARKKTPSAAQPAPDVKLYHLTQAGRAEPIRLFVRLVGDSERVMVRVGGGWADLADFLRQYADHHASRTVSAGSALEVQTVSGSATSARRTFSGPADPRVGGAAGTPAGAGRPPFTPVGARVSEGPCSRDGKGVASQQQLRSASAMAYFDDGDDDDDESVRAEAAGGGGVTRPRSSASAAELPPSASKAKWVEGMIERAKQSASAERGREERERRFAELGRVGGTRRVVWKGGK